MQRILDKGGEYYQCARHMNMRGLNDVLKETVEVVATVKAEGKTFEDLLAYMEAEFKQKPDVSKDTFLQAVQKMWEQA